MFRSMSVAAKLFWMFVPIFVIGIVLSFYLTNTYQEDQMQAQALESANQKAHIVRESLVNMMISSQRVDDGYLERVKNVADLNDLYIRIDTARLHLPEDYMDSIRTARLASRMRYAQQKDVYDNSYGNEVLRTGEPKWLRIGDNFRAMIPFRAEKKCQRCHEVEIGDIIGVAHLEFPLSKIIQTNQENSLRSAAVNGGVALVVIIIGFIVFRSLVQSPIKKLELATRKIGTGDMSGDLVLPEGSDEIGMLARAFVQMRSALKQSQDAIRISTVGQVARSLVQDFRAPINTIESTMTEMRNPQLELSKRNALLDEAKAAALLVNKMTQDLIDFTAGDITVDRSLTGIGSLLRGVAAAVKQDLDRQKISLRVTPVYDSTALIDAERTARALDNIITYAANYIPAGGTITLASDSQNGKLILRISDNGSGIPEMFKEKIFEPFVKVVQGGGVGLDLALAKMIIEKQGGAITLQSEEGKGTTYQISLPM